jgi:hypothetical protein
MVPAIDPAAAQSLERPSITVSETITVRPESQVPLPIQVAPVSAIPRNSFLRIRGLPPIVALSEGHSIGPGSWAVSLQGLSALRIMVPSAPPGRFEFVITLVALDGAELDQKKSALVIQDPARAGRQTGTPPPGGVNLGGTAPPRPTPAERPTRPAAPAAAGPEREWALKLAKEGDQHLSQGNIAAARNVYELAADAGLAQAAMALAATYDAAELRRFSVRGIEPNAKEAQRWYERARQLGAVEAEQRLRRLGAK